MHLSVHQLVLVNRQAGIIEEKILDKLNKFGRIFPHVKLLMQS